MISSSSSILEEDDDEDEDEKSLSQYTHSMHSRLLTLSPGG